MQDGEDRGTNIRRQVQEIYDERRYNHAQGMRYTTARGTTQGLQVTRRYQDGKPINVDTLYASNPLFLPLLRKSRSPLAALQSPTSNSLILTSLNLFPVFNLAQVGRTFQIPCHGIFVARDEKIQSV